MTINPYRAAGTFDGASYVERDADKALMKEIINNSRYPYLLAPRQSGKSSLIAHTIKILEKSGIRTSFVDLSTFPQKCFNTDDGDIFFEYFASEISKSLSSSPEFKEASPMDRVRRTLVHAVSESKQRLVIFVDEVDRLISTKFKDYFFSTVRSFFNKRATDFSADYSNIQFVLSGAAHHTQLITNTNTSPFNVGVEISLDDLTFEQVKRMTHLLKTGGHQICRDLCTMIYRYTNGSVFLTQLVLEKIWECRGKNQNKIFTKKVAYNVIKEIINNSHRDVHFFNLFLTVSNQHNTSKDADVSSRTKIFVLDQGIKTKHTSTHKTSPEYRNFIYQLVFGLKGPLSLENEPLYSSDNVCVISIENYDFFLSWIRKSNYFAQITLDIWDLNRLISCRWREEIAFSLSKSKIAIILVSENFLESEFQKYYELSLLLEQSIGHGLRVIWSLVNKCSYQSLPLIDKFFALNPSTPLENLVADNRKKVEFRLHEMISEAFISKPFRALVLATEKDLGFARDNTVAYLREVLLMEAVAGSTIDPPDPSDFDLVILIQAWYWASGVLAQVWSKTDSSKRLLFVIDENADWPPRKLCELAAVEEIETFRQIHCEAISFKIPDAIPNLVGEAADRFRREQLPHQETHLGLSDLERAYLEIRLPTWQAGRIGFGKRFSSSDDIYEEHFYVPLDGASFRWTWDETHGLLKAKDNSEISIERIDRDKLRRPLAWWASRAKLPWLVLSGPPGAGKTIFLTRFAAGLGHYLLGGLTQIEPHLEPMGLRSNKKIPIPIILEATGLAKRNLVNLSDLVNAVHDELCCTGLTEMANKRRTEKALLNGFYLVLIDALDEVPGMNSRRQLLLYLKSLRSKLNNLRLIITTRSARYTGDMAFGPEFEVLELADLNDDQVGALCDRFRALKGESKSFLDKLLGALRAVAARTDNDEANLIGNPLLLATACSIFYKLGHLPNDRAALCYQIVEHLCWSRVSQLNDHQGHHKKEWALLPEQKRDLLERIALAMQKEKAQIWPMTRVYEIVAEGLSTQARERDRVAQYVNWLVEHTGLLYIQAGDQGESLRFHHRLFREYLAACCLTKKNIPIETVLEKMWSQGWLTDPYWLDVLRLIPGSVNSVDKSSVIGNYLVYLADSHPDQRGRLLAVLSAILVESRNLFRMFDVSQFLVNAISIYEDEGLGWDTPTRLLFLENIGWLGDSRIDAWSSTYWVPFSPGRFMMGGEELFSEPKHQTEISEPFMIAKYPVTNGEYSSFISEGGYLRREFWSSDGWYWLHLNNDDFERWYREKQEKYIDQIGFNDPNSYLPSTRPLSLDDPTLNNPNQPVAGVSWYEATAYCKWLTQKMVAEKPKWWTQESPFMVTLPTETEWEYVAHGCLSRLYPWGDDQGPNPDRANYGASRLERTTPVGAYPMGATPEGVQDIAGNVWEWCRDVWKEDAQESRVSMGGNPENNDGDPAARVLRGGAWFDNADCLRTSYRLWNHVWGRSIIIGFRCCVVRRWPEHD